MNNADALQQPTLQQATVPKPSEKQSGFPAAPILFFVAVWLGGSSLVVGAWLQPLLPGGWLTVAAFLATIAIPVSTLLRGLEGSLYPSAPTRLFIFRPFWYAMLFMPLLAAATLAGGLVGLIFGEPGTSGRWALGGASLLLAGAAVWGYLGSRRLQVRHLAVQMPGLPKAFDGLRIVQISDLHVGPHTPKRFLQRVATKVQEANPDLIAVTGDQVDDFAQDADLFAQAFQSLDAPLGTVVVAGNHDIYAGWNGVQRRLSKAGFSVLVNEAFTVQQNGQRLWVVGTGDPAGQGYSPSGGADAAPNIAKALNGIPADEPVIALAHNPALWPVLAQAGVDLTLSGHTHYGQFAIPSRNWSAASPFLKLAMGAHRLGTSLLYINPGTGYWGIPFRIGTDPEVTVLTLSCSGEAGISPA